MEPVRKEELLCPLEEALRGPHFKLTKLPMPPSSNHQYWHQIMPGKGGGGQVARPTPTGDLKKFQKAMEEWKNRNLVAAHKCRALIREWQLHGKQIRVDVLAFFNYFDLFTQQGTPKRMDVSNRMKAMHDCLAEMMEVDDSWYWSVAAHKYEIKGTEPWCAVVFSPIEHMSLADLKEKGIL